MDDAMKLELPKLEQRGLPSLVGHRPWCQQDKECGVQPRYSELTTSYIQ